MMRRSDQSTPARDTPDAPAGATPACNRAARQPHAAYQRICRFYAGVAADAAKLGLPAGWVSIAAALHRDARGACHISRYCSHTFSESHDAVIVTFDGATPVRLCGYCAIAPAKVSRAHGRIIAALNGVIDAAGNPTRDSAAHQHTKVAEVAWHATHSVAGIELAALPAAPTAAWHTGNNAQLRDELAETLRVLAHHEYQQAADAARRRTIDEVAALHAELLGADHHSWGAYERSMLTDSAAGTFTPASLPGIAADGLEATIAKLAERTRPRHSRHTPPADPAAIADELRRVTAAALAEPLVLLAHHHQPDVEIPDVWPRRHGTQPHMWTTLMLPRPVAHAVCAHDSQLIVSDVEVGRPDDAAATLETAHAVFTALAADTDVRVALDTAAALVANPT